MLTEAGLQGILQCQVVSPQPIESCRTNRQLDLYFSEMMDAPESNQFSKTEQSELLPTFQYYYKQGCKRIPLLNLYAQLCPCNKFLEVKFQLTWICTLSYGKTVSLLLCVSFTLLSFRNTEIAQYEIHASLQ